VRNQTITYSPSLLHPSSSPSSRIRDSCGTFWNRTIHSHQKRISVDIYWLATCERNVLTVRPKFQSHYHLQSDASKSVKMPTVSDIGQWFMRIVTACNIVYSIVGIYWQSRSPNFWMHPAAKTASPIIGGSFAGTFTITAFLRIYQIMTTTDLQLCERRVSWSTFDPPSQASLSTSREPQLSTPSKRQPPMFYLCLGGP